MLVKNAVGAVTRRQIDDWWMRWHLTFLFPPMYSGHVHVWKSINSECVGCIACGVVHLCSSSNNIVPCAMEQQDDTSLVCTYTGIVATNTSFFDPETSIADYNAGYFTMQMDTHAHKHKNPSLQHKIEVLDNITTNVIHLLFFSKQARCARDTEKIRFNRKIASVFTAHVSRSKNSFAQCNIVSGMEACMFSVASYRRPVDDADIPPPRHFLKLQRIIVSLLSSIQLPRQFIFNEQNEKMKNLVISLVYISSDGISYDGHVYMPKISGLKQILPLELVLSKCFGIQPKIVTDGENIIKMSIKTTKENTLHCYNGEENTCTLQTLSAVNADRKHHTTHSARLAHNIAANCNFTSTKICTCMESPDSSDDWIISPVLVLPPTKSTTPPVSCVVRKRK